MSLTTNGNWPPWGGEAAERIRIHPWEQTPLGRAGGWPLSLRRSIELVLGMPTPAMLAWGSELIVCAYNDAYRPLLCDKPEALGRPFLQVWSEAATHIEPQLKSALAGTPGSFHDAPFHTNRLGQPDEAFFDYGFAPVRDDQGSVAGVLNTTTEVTERHRFRRSDQALQESESRYRMLIDRARDYAIFTMDADGFIDSWPPGAAAVFGWRDDEIIGQHFSVTFSPEDRAAGTAEAELSKARSSGVAADVRWHQRKDGQRVFIEGTNRALSDDSGQFTGYLKIGQDITERRLAESRLRASEERFRQFGEASADVLWIRSAKSQELEYVSPAAAEVYGLTAEELLQASDLTSWAKSIIAEDRAAALAALQQVRNGKGVTHEFRFKRPSDGEIRWIADTAFPLAEPDGQIQRIGGISHDITDEKDSAERLKVLVAELQHRTRNLLAVIRAVSDRTLATSHSLQEFGARFGARLGALARVNGLLSRLEEGHRITFDELLRTELSGHGILDADRKHQLILDGPPGVRLRSAMVQTFALALHELATNALKYGAFSQPSGRLAVRWRVMNEGSEQTRLRVDWEESGVAVASNTEGSPSRLGYGRELIERALPYLLNTETRYELTPSGVHCSIILPISTTESPASDR